MRHRSIIAAALVLFSPAALGVLPFGFWKRTTSASETSFPATLGNLAAWWKADSFSLSDGTAIGGTGNEWVDQSGNGKTLTQSTSGSRPVFKTSIVNGQPTIRFDGSDDTLVFSDHAVSSNGLTLVVVMAQSANDGCTFGGTGQWGMRHNWLGITKTVFNCGGFPQSDNFSVAATSFKMVTFRRTASSETVSFRENTTARGTVAMAWSEANVILNRIGCRGEGNQHLNGDIAEALIYTDELSDANVDSLYNSYLKPKYGLP